MAENVFEKIVSLAKRRGFYYPGSEIYGGLANTYDYGPLGAELLRNIKNLWWSEFIHKRTDMVGLDSSIISSAKIWEASGHASGFSDAMIDCKNCKSRFRADHIVEDYLETKDEADLMDKLTIEGISSKELENAFKTKKVEGWSEEKFDEFIKAFKIPCPKCGKVEWTKVRKFNLLFPVKLGIVEGDQSLAYLRGETAQGIFTNFKNVVDSTRVRLPFGIGQIGKSFRNEITLGNSIFRTIEFEQAEIEYFFDEKKTNWEELFTDWKEAMNKFVVEKLGVNSQNLRWRTHTDEERSFYSKKTEDLEYKFPFGFKELWGLAYRTNYDLSQHSKHSGIDLTIADPYTQEKIMPHVIEPAVGVTRLLLMVLCDAYYEDEKRVVLKLSPKLAPYKVAIFPLVGNKEELTKKADEVFTILKQDFAVTFDDRGNIGKRYLYQDEMGTPWCVTVDYQTLEDNTVTIRDRDTMEQIRMSIDELPLYFQSKL